MKDKDKTKEQLINELAQLRQRIIELESSKADFKHTEEKLNETKDYLDKIIASSLDGIVVSDYRGYITRVNKAFLKLIYFEEEEVVGKHVAELTPYENGTYESTTGELVEINEEFIYDAMEVLEILFEKGTISNWEIYYLRKDGKIIPVEMKIAYLYNDEGDIIGSVGINRDFTERRQIEKSLREAHQKLEEKVMKRTAALMLANEQLQQEINVRKQAEEELRESEGKYRKLIDTANDAIFVANAETGIIIDANKRAAELLGVPVEEIIGMNQTQLHPKEDRDHYRNIFTDHVQREKGVIKGDIFICHKNGYKVPVEISASVTEIGDKRVVQGIFRDITERRLAEEEIKKTKHHLDNIIESSIDSIVVSDSKGKITRVNKAFFKLIGYKEEEIIGKYWYNLMPRDVGTYELITGDLLDVNEDFLNDSKAVGSKLYEEGKIDNRESYLLHKNGKVLLIENNIVLLQNEEGEVIGGVAIIRDIAQRKKAEENLRKSEKKYQNLIEHANDAILSTNKDGMIIAFNKKAEKIFGYSYDEILGKPAYLLVSPESREENERGLKMFKETRRLAMDGKIMEGMGLRKGGQEFSTEFSIHALELHGEYIATSIVRDITERKKAEKQLFDYQSRLKSLTSQMTLTEEQDRKRFADYLHDQIGQKLFGLKLKMEEMRNSAYSSNTANTLDDSFKIIKQLIKDTRSLTFDLSPPILYQFGLEAALEWLTEQTSEQYGIMVAFEDDEQEKELNDDIKILLFQAVRELLLNVAKHAKAQNAKVSIKRDNTQIRICVADNGVGFTPSSKDVSKAANEGFGLFSIGERLNHLGGQFEIESQPDCGTQVTLVAPLKGKREI